MIKLKPILAEISLAGVQPYATQFVWTDKWNDAENYETRIQADGQPILLRMDWFRQSNFGDGGEWVFAFFTQDRQRAWWNLLGLKWTTSAKVSAASGQVNTLRLFKTIGLAIRDFADTRPGVDVIDVTGGDSDTAKQSQKSRIYAGLLQANPELSDFRVETIGGHLYLIRRNPNQPRPDASGIDTPNDPDM